MELVDFLGDRWGLAVARPEPLDGGMNSQTWLVVASDGRRLVAKAVGRANSGFVPGLELAGRLDRAGLTTGAPVLSRSGLVAEVWGSQHLAVLEFVDGVPLTGTVEDQAAIGATLARVHEIAQVPAGDLEKWFGLITGLEAYWDLEPWIRPAIEDAVDGVRAYAASHELTWAGLHADPAADAFIRQPSGEIALIDWGGWMLGPTLYDIASAIMYAGQPEPLVSAYRAKRPDLQTDAIPTFLRFRHAVQASYFAYRITENIQTGVVPGNENSKGLADARRSLLGAP